jgi:drug/metabolite transporter (DMT)-like permease
MIAIMPYFIAVAAICFYASLSPMAKKIGFNLPPFSLIAISSFIHLCIAGSIAFAKERHVVLAGFDKIEWHWLLIFSITNLIGYVLYLLALSKIPVAQYQMFTLLTPIVGGLLAVLLLKEPFHARYFIALAFMGIGIAIAIGPELRSK